MSAERLKTLVEQGNLINLNIVSDSLGALLNEIAQMLVDQQRQLSVMKKEITEKLEKKDYNQFINQWQNDRNMILRSIPNFDQVVGNLLRDMDHKNEELRTHVDQSVDQVLISVDTRIEEKIGTLESDNLLIQHKFDVFDQKYRNAAMQVTKADIDGIKKRLLKVESDLAQQDSHKVDAKLIEEFKEEIEKKLCDIQPNSSSSSSFNQDTDKGLTSTLQTSTEFGMPRFGGCGCTILDSIEPIEPIEENDIVEDDVSELRKRIESIEAKLEEHNKNHITRTAWRSELTLVERMFEKSRKSVATLKDEVDKSIKLSEQCVKKVDLDDFIEKRTDSYLEAKNIVSTGPPLRCIGIKTGEEKKVRRSSNCSLPPHLPVLLVPHRK